MAMAYIVMAYIVMAYTVKAHIGMAYIGMAYIVRAHIGMAYIVMAGTVVARSLQRVDTFGALEPGGYIALYRLYIGIADGMCIARVWACRYPK